MDGPDIEDLPDDGSPYSLFSGSADLLEGLDAEESRNRLQGLLSEWLRIENLVALLGAGCSVEYGGPLLSHLEEDVLNAVSELGQAFGLAKPARDIVEDRRTAAPDASTFEPWLSALSTARHAVSSPSPFVELHTADRKEEEGARKAITSDMLSELSELIATVAATRCSLELPALDQDRATAHHAFLAKLVARDPTLGRAHVFTTNYDLLLEAAADDLRIRYANGFVGSVKQTFDSSAYALDLYYPGEVAEGRVQRFDKFFHLYKLHGSVDWRREEQDQVIRLARQPGPLWTEWEELTSLQKIERLRDSEDGRLAILPTEGKYLESLGMPYAHLFRSFDLRLKTPQTFFLVIGYGFGDQHINMLIDEALTNPGIVLLVVDPVGPESIRERLARYQAAGERAFLLTEREEHRGKSPKVATFEDFSGNVMPHVRWLDDFLRLRRTEALIRSGSPRPPGNPDE